MLRNNWSPIFALILICSFVSQLCAEPWGKDADLCHRSSTRTSPTSCKTTVIGPLSEILIGFHQNIISKADGPRSHFKPSSSQYTLDAMRKYGFFQGFLMGCDRLMRENKEPWVYRTVLVGDEQTMKSDPVR